MAQQLSALCTRLLDITLKHLLRMTSEVVMRFQTVMQALYASCHGYSDTAGTLTLGGLRRQVSAFELHQCCARVTLIVE